jgi:hypothetical protein
MQLLWVVITVSPKIAFIAIGTHATTSSRVYYIYIICYVKLMWNVLSEGLKILTIVRNEPREAFVHKVACKRLP